MSVTKVTGMMQTSTKGGDISSASPCVIDTDGDYFDVTGTTNFTAFTVVAGRRFTIQFDGILIMTHHATNLDLPGGANITTAAGDVAEFFATGTNTVQCVNYTKADGTAVVAAGGGKVLQVISEELGKYNQTSTSTTIDYMIKADDSDWALAITPASTSNYLIITLTAGVAYTASGAQNRYIVSPFANIGGGGFTQLFSNSFMGCYQAGDVLNTQFENLYTNIIKYSPSTTSEVTIKIGYKVFYSGNGATLRMNPQSGTETVLTVMEIEG